MSVSSLAEARLKKMTNDEVFIEAVKCGRQMEKGSLNVASKAWAKLVFEEAYNRATDETLKYNCQVALKVLKFF